MKYILLYFFISTAVVAQTNKIEIEKKFVPENNQLAHDIIETNVWNFPKSILLFYAEKIVHEYKGENYTHNAVYGYLLVKKGTDYTKILIDRYEDDNVDTEILSVFFANVDKDKQKELVILTANRHRLQYLYEGTEYGVYFYDNFSPDTIPKQLQPIWKKNLERFQGNFEGFKGEENWKSKFKTADDIKKELKRMGY